MSKSGYAQRVVVGCLFPTDKLTPILQLQMKPDPPEEKNLHFPRPIGGAIVWVIVLAVHLQFIRRGAIPDVVAEIIFFVIATVIFALFFRKDTLEETMTFATAASLISLSSSWMLSLFLIPTTTKQGDATEGYAIAVGVIGMPELAIGLILSLVYLKLRDG